MASIQSVVGWIGFIHHVPGGHKFVTLIVNPFLTLTTIWFPSKLMRVLHALVGRICADFVMNCSLCVKSIKFSGMIDFFILVNIGYSAMENFSV